MPTSGADAPSSHGSTVTPSIGVHGGISSGRKTKLGAVAGAGAGTENGVGVAIDIDTVAVGLGVEVHAGFGCPSLQETNSSIAAASKIQNITIWDCMLTPYRDWLRAIKVTMSYCRGLQYKPVYA